MTPHTHLAKASCGIIEPYRVPVQGRGYNPLLILRLPEYLYKIS